MMRRSHRPLFRLLFSLLLVAFSLTLTGCGRPPLTGGRPYPPDFDSKGYPRAMVAVQNPSGGTAGAMQLIDVEHDTVSNQENTVHVYDINGFNGALPVSIQDFPGSTEAYVYASGTQADSFANASFTPVNTATDRTGSTISGLSGPSPGGPPQNLGGVFISSDFQFVYAGNPSANGGYFTIVRLTDGYVTHIPQPAVSRLALSPGSQSVLFFADNSSKNSNDLFQVVGIGQNSVYDCDQQILLKNASYDKPINALYSSDGTSAFIMNCGPECGGNTASVTILSTADLLNAASAAYTGKTGCNIPAPNTVAPATLTPTATINVPGGVTDLLQAGSTLFVTGQQLLSDGYFAGTLTIIDLVTDQVTGTYTIGDGFHFRMRLGNNNTLWIGAKSCESGEQSATGGIMGCITMVPLTQNGPDSTYTASDSSIVIEPAHGDAGGIAPITPFRPASSNEPVTYNKTYTVEGTGSAGIYIYSTVDGSEISNYYAQVTGTPMDIAFIDGDTITGPSQ